MRILRQTEITASYSVPPAATGTARFCLGRVAPGAEPLDAFFPDFAIDRRHVRATRADATFIVLGEGLLRAPPRGRSASPWLSALALKTTGPTSPSVDALSPDRVLSTSGWWTPQLKQRAAVARRALVSSRVGGSWWQSGGEGDLPPGDGYVLVALNEPAVAGALPRPNAATLGTMIDMAVAEHPPDRVAILAPRVSRFSNLHGRLAAAAAQGATIISHPLDPWTAIERAGWVYSTGGEIGFLTLLAERCPVICFGDSFYTGKGLTGDAAGMLSVVERPFQRSIDEVFAANCLIATRYRDPFNNCPASFEDTLGLLAEWRKIETANRGIAVCVGMSFWKRRRIADFVRSADAAPVFRRTAGGAIAEALRGPAAPRAIAGWTSRLPAGLAETAARQGVPVIRVEDGFVRSVGLGSDFLPPASLVFDSRGMYFDPRTPSDLEILLRETEFDPALLARARRLAAQLVARGVTKYNLAATGPVTAVPSDRRRILVPGQVEDDLSIKFGGGDIRTNLALLAEARSANPDAFILYKPHPDVMAGHRKGAVPGSQARRFADAVVEDASTASLLDLVDELHTMTSLAGFEALLRGRRVVVHGRPFYAGWGLTVDRLRQDRGRRLSLDELVAGVLILYPRYLDPLTRLPCGPEIIIERIDHPELWRPGLLVQARRLQGTMARRFRELRALLPTVGFSPARGLRERLRH
jgi:capsular polysaccharide export protein